jgi:hypothetical protein
VRSSDKELELLLEMAGIAEAGARLPGLGYGREVQNAGLTGQQGVRAAWTATSDNG